MPDSSASGYSAQSTLTAGQARRKLIEGNRRFISGLLGKKDPGEGRRIDLFRNGQHPFAVVLTCSDSRVPPEIIFDQGLGDLFVIRTAGNVIDDVSLGSIEYGAEHLGAPLLVVLGHSNCGAVQASVEGGEAPGCIGAIVDRIKPMVQQLKACGVSGDLLYEKVENENIMMVMTKINESPVVKHLIKQGKLEINAAKYHLDTGEVVFFPNP